MKHFFSIISLWIVGITMSAQGISGLWKQYEGALEKDQPKTALAVLHNIEKKAEKERRYGDLLAATLREVAMQREVSDDSMKACKERIVRKQKAWRQKGQNVLATLCQTALYQEQGAPKIDSILVSPDAGIYTAVNGEKDYTPFLEIGKDSKLLDGSLLTLIALHTNQRKALYRYFSQTANRPAAAIAAALWMEHDTNTERMDSLINVYGDLKECGAIAVKKYTYLPNRTTEKSIAWIDEAVSRWGQWPEVAELKNERMRLTTPLLNARFSKNIATTDDEAEIIVEAARNISGVLVEVRTEKDVWMRRNTTYSGHKEYELLTDTITLGRLPKGIWRMSIVDKDRKLPEEVLTLRVTDLRVIAQRQPKDITRYVVVNNITGKPVANATLQLAIDEKHKNVTTLHTDGRGECTYKGKQSRYEVRAETADDKAMDWESLRAYYNQPAKIKELKRVDIYTDRAIYRPGQQVQAAIICSRTKGIDTEAATSVKITATLYDSEGKEQGKQELTTDSYGTARATFTLPKDTRNGLFRISTKKGGDASFRVEEYKRPLYEVTLTKPTEKYASGDTVYIKGVAKTYSGVAVADAKVTYTVSRAFQWWWRYSGGREVLNNDTVRTDDEGRFTVAMPMILPEEAQNNKAACYYSVKADVTVTDKAGESHEATLSLPLSNREAWLSLNMADKVIADNFITITLKRRNIAGEDIDGTIAMTLDGKQLPSAKANKSYTLPSAIKSGKHKLTAICEKDTIEHEFIAFRKTDKVPMTFTHEWFFCSNQQWENENDEVWIQVGTSDKDVHAVYSICSGDSIIEKGAFKMNNSIVTRTFKYDKAWGDGICFTVAWVKDGKMYSHSKDIKRPIPSKELNLSWHTFRDRLSPGQKEQWTVKIEDKDGKPAEAQLMAVLYDKSLEALRKHSWTLTDYRTLSMPYLSWRSALRGGTESYYHSLPIKELNVKPLAFTQINPDCLPMTHRILYTRALSGGRVMTKGKNSLMAARANSKAIGTFDCVESVSEYSVAAQAADKENIVVGYGGKGNSKPEEDITPMRTDLAETAFFMPQVKSNEKGLATISFTLPQSVTTWRFMALAHDREMRSGTMTSDVIAQKAMMVQPLMPRFLRKGDKATISATIANTTEKALSPKVVMTLLDAESEQVVMRKEQNVTLAAGKTAVATFDVDAAQLTEGMLVCRIMAEDKTASDGEQHYLPILSDKEQVTATRTYVYNEPTDTILTFSDMVPATAEKPHLTVRYIDNPAWLMMEALKTQDSYCDKNAISLSNAYYVNKITAALKGLDNDTTSTKVLEALKKLQKPNGSWSWWEGMNGSLYMTLAVSETLARLNALIGKQAETTAMLDKSFDFIKEQMEQQVEKMKQQEKKGFKPYLSNTQLTWLYALTLEERQGGKAAEYLKRLIEKATKSSDMMTKATAAIIMQHEGKKSKAKEYAESIKQHTVYREDVGRYFDSYRASYSWCDYRIPTQVRAIEALRYVTPQDRGTINEMLRWLMSSKRTQSWDNAVNAVNAIHAFLLPDTQERRHILDADKGDAILANHPITAEEPAMVKVAKTTPQESWLSALVTYTQQVNDISETGTGLSIKRDIIYKGKAIDKDTKLTVGDKVKVVITVTADRDYDFVSITDNRPACLEPLNQLSGYRSGYYAQIKDKASTFYYDMMRKGTHTIETEYAIERKGTYTSGAATALCTYATEFRATTGTKTITVE